MARKCDICGKGPQFGNRVSHAHNKTRHKFLPNLHAVTVTKEEGKQKLKVCSTCLRTMKKTV
jgi:large subunit ribosomal protein L28